MPRDYAHRTKLLEGTLTVLNYTYPRFQVQILDGNGRGNPVCSEIG